MLLPGLRVPCSVALCLQTPAGVSPHAPPGICTAGDRRTRTTGCPEELGRTAPPRGRPGWCCSRVFPKKGHLRGSRAGLGVDARQGLPCQSAPGEQGARGAPARSAFCSPGLVGRGPRPWWPWLAAPQAGGVTARLAEEDQAHTRSGLATEGPGQLCRVALARAHREEPFPEGGCCGPWSRTAAPGGQALRASL